MKAQQSVGEVASEKRKCITVSCLRRDPQGYGVQKYNNDDGWNVPGGMAPNGVSATRYLRDTTPEVKQLSPLAAWLVQHLPDYVAGRMQRISGNLRVEARASLQEVVRAQHPEKAERMIRVYDIPPEARHTWCWLFPQILPSETDTEYWNRVAKELLAADLAKVSVDGAELRLDSLVA